jgi:hypothetical protein
MIYNLYNYELPLFSINLLFHGEPRIGHNLYAEGNRLLVCLDVPGSDWGTLSPS